MGHPYGPACSYLGAAVIVVGGAFLHSTVLPDAPVFAFLLSLLAGSLATIATALAGRGAF